MNIDSYKPKQATNFEKIDTSKLSAPGLALLALLAADPVAAQSRNAEVAEQKPVEQVIPDRQPTAEELFRRWMGNQETDEIERRARNKVYQEQVIPMLNNLGERWRKRNEEQGQKSE
ncbi:MAG: hypothetical protein JO019_00865 [Candidatus Kaiserbacteria bacterium]|nr:hypothetical protein [Candidatus Kaiserbacteria bacterium]